jgi:hypothetical protein
VWFRLKEDPSPERSSLGRSVYAPGLMASSLARGDDLQTCGVCAIDLATGQVVALLRFETAVREVFAVTVLAGKRYPDLINDNQKQLENSFTVPDAALVDVPASLKGPTQPNPRAAGSAGNGGVPRVPFVTA